MYVYEFEYEDEITQKTYQVEVKISTTFERNWGSDADGNRGMARYFHEVDDITVSYDSEQVVDAELIQRVEKYYEKYKEEDALDKAEDSNYGR